MGHGDKCRTVESPPTMSDLLDKALNYAARGWRVLRIYPLKHGVCTCRDKEDVQRKDRRRS